MRHRRSRPIERVSVQLAMSEARTRYPDCSVVEMPHNNPGFDIEVRRHGSVIRYIEVKGTLSRSPEFYISIGEVEHSRVHSAEYSIWIFHSIDLGSGSAVLAEHDGTVDGPAFALQPVQYRGRFVAPSASSSVKIRS